MRSFPTIIATEQDVVELLKFYPKEMKEKLMLWRDHRFGWFNAGPIETGEGITDSTHKVVGQRDDEMNPDSPITLMQYEYREDPNAYMFLIGLTVEKIEAYLASA